MVYNQANLFLVFTLNGVIIGLLFDIFRILRKSFKTNNFITYIEDMIFWILTGLILLYSVFSFSNGEIRLYMFIAVLIGCILYMLMLSKYFITINVKIILTIKNIVKKILIIVLWPIKKIFILIHFIIQINCKFLKKLQFFQKLGRIFKKKVEKYNI